MQRITPTEPVPEHQERFARTARPAPAQCDPITGPYRLEAQRAAWWRARREPLLCIVLPVAFVAGLLLGWLDNFRSFA